MICVRGSLILEGGRHAVDYGDIYGETDELLDQRNVSMMINFTIISTALTNVSAATLPDRKFFSGEGPTRCLLYTTHRHHIYMWLG